MTPERYAILHPVKVCSKCGIEKPIGEFYPNRQNGNYRPDCKPCNKARVKAWTEANPTSHKKASYAYYQRNKEAMEAYAKNYAVAHPLAAKDRHLRQRYGIDLATFNALSQSQGGLCAICAQPKKLCVDHNHRTGAVRGLLCLSCNQGIGLFHEDKEALRIAVRYIAMHKAAK